MSTRFMLTRGIQSSLLHLSIFFFCSNLIQTRNIARKMLAKHVLFLPEACECSRSTEGLESESLFAIMLSAEKINRCEFLGMSLTFIICRCCLHVLQQARMTAQTRRRATLIPKFFDESESHHPLHLFISPEVCK